MKNWLVLAGGLLALGVVPSAQVSHTSVVFFSDPSGLAAQARFELTNGGNTLVVTVCNTSTGSPVWFTLQDQLLSSLAFDLGAPGVNASDPGIASGTVRTGPTSASINFSLAAVGPDQDVSGEYGYGNAGAGTLRPNFVSSMDLGGLPFGGPNLDATTELSGPEGGLMAGLASIPLTGESGIQNEIVIELNLDQALSDMQFLSDGGASVGFGSGTLNMDATCDHDSYSVTTPDAGGLNAPNSLFPMGIPSIGNPNYKVCMDEAANACGITPRTFTFVAFSPGLASILLPGFGCLPGSPGELMIDLSLPHMVLGPQLWSGPGSPACHPLPIPADPTLCRTVCFGQGIWFDPTRFILTNRLDFVIGV